MASTLPQPVYVLRGHSTHITSVRFAKQNTRLLTADTDGWLTVWSLSTKRPTAVWKAHNQAILGIETWGEDCYLTHGREQKIIVWHLPVKAENGFSTLLPAERPNEHRKQPWILHSLKVKASGFCPFAVCRGYRPRGDVDDSKHSLLVAVPGRESVVEILSLPDENTLHSVHAPNHIKAGMIMTVKLAHKADYLLLCSGYESGYTIVQTLKPGKSKWDTAYVANPHSQPVLSIDISPSLETYFTSAADSVIAKHPLFRDEEKEKASFKRTVDNCVKQVTTRHAGQQLIRVRSDGRIVATAGWDGRIRVYSAQKLNQLAVLIWHKQGCYALDFASVTPDVISAEGENLEQEDIIPLSRSNTLRPVDRRETEAQSTHWLAAGSKDGKISLWDIY